jgi:2-polyprenyl-3-methyl-5-hydroxy-6-metoxy-1,4-benzoquinol methylase
VDSPCIICGRTATRKLFAKGGRDFIRCEGCGLVRVDPLPTPEENQHYYDETYREWYSTFHKATDIRRLIAEHRMDEVAAFARPGHWLDVGCAAGQFVALARERGIDAEGLDIAPAAIEQAQAQGIPAHLGSVEEFSPPRQYDTITAFDVLEHTIRPTDFLDRVRTWLVPDGTLALTLPDVSSAYPQWIMRRHWFYYLPNDHLHYFDPSTVRALLEQRGFRVEKVGRAYKLLTGKYIVEQLNIFNPWLGRLATALAAVVPAAALAKPRLYFIGEMMVHARKEGA